MTIQRRSILIVLFIGCCLTLWGCDSINAGNAGQPSADSAAAAPSSGQAATDFALANLNGETVSLSGLKGKKVLLDFWATWCPPCRSELPDMNSMIKDLNDKGIVVLNISVDNDLATVKQFIERYNYTNLTVLHDASGASAQNYAVSAIPTKVFIDETGNIINTHVGALSGEKLKEFLGLK